MTVKEIAAQRILIESLEDQKNDIWDAIKVTAEMIAYENKRDEITKAVDALTLLSTQYRKQNISIYLDTGETKFEGGDVRIRKAYDYNNDLAREWIIKHDHLELFKVDNKEFLKVAKAVKLDFLQIEEKPTFYLKSDLSEFLKE